MQAWRIERKKYLKNNAIQRGGRPYSHKYRRLENWGHYGRDERVSLTNKNVSTTVTDK